MRLIDADALPNIYNSTHQEIILAIESAPTVEAIPTEFIQEQINKMYDKKLIFTAYPLEEMLKIWREFQ